MRIDQIAEGTINNILDNNKDLYSERMKICRSCKLYLADGIIGPICNPRLYLNPQTNEISRIPKLGFIRGCGCLLSSKTRVKKAKCGLNKW